MTDPLPRVVVPYADFIKHREQRRALAAEAERQNLRRTIDTEAIPAAAPLLTESAIATPLSSDGTDRSEHQSPVHNAERIT